MKKKARDVPHDKTPWRMGALAACCVMFIASQAWSRPAMTINTKNPAAYVQWVQGSGEAIAESINAAVGGICVPSAGYTALESSITGTSLEIMRRPWALSNTTPR
jgi:hypothetical protein